MCEVCRSSSDALHDFGNAVNRVLAGTGQTLNQWWSRLNFTNDSPHLKKWDPYIKMRIPLRDILFV